MITIWKYEIPIQDHTVVQMPEYADVLPYVQMSESGGGITIWARVDTETPLVDHHLHVRGTGHEIKMDDEYWMSYVDTVIDGRFVWHVFVGYPETFFRVETPTSGQRDVVNDFWNRDLWDRMCPFDGTVELHEDGIVTLVHISWNPIDYPDRPIYVPTPLEPLKAMYLEDGEIPTVSEYHKKEFRRDHFNRWDRRWVYVTQPN